MIVLVPVLAGEVGASPADLMLRFYDPDSGSIEIDGVDLRQLQRDSLLDQVAVVSQEPFLFEGSRGDNIRYGRPGASDGEVEAAARAAEPLAAACRNCRRPLRAWAKGCRVFLDFFIF